MSITQNINASNVKSSTTVAIKVNQDKLIANLKFSFSNKTTVLGEMMQNARRAGATKVEITYNANGEHGDLIIEDNGKGIEDFQHLFSIAESGWDLETIAKEKPFGMGWLSCLYGAKRIYVESNGKYVQGDTGEILTGAALEVLKADLKKKKSYTKVVLEDFALTLDKTKQTLQHLATGFAIDVIFNGEALERTDAVDVLAVSGKRVVQDAGLGVIYLADYKTQYGYQMDESRVTIYLQGLPVYSSYNRFYHPEHHIVHLDSSLFNARLPDRDKLVDEEEVLKLVKKTINAARLAHLVELKNTLSAEEFAKPEIVRYARSIDGGLEVLAGEDVRFSSYFFGEIADAQPSCYHEDETVKHSQKAESYSLEEVRQRKVQFCTMDNMVEYEESNAAAYVFARQMGWLIVQDRNMLEKAKHWVSSYIHQLSHDKIEVEILGETKRSHFNFNCWQVSVDIVLCDSYLMSYTDDEGNLHKVDVKNEPLLTNDGLLLVPGECLSHAAADMAVMQGCSYYWEDDFHSDEQSEDIQAFHLYLEMMRTGDEVKTMQGLLDTIYSSTLHEMIGKEFKLTINDKGRPEISKL